MLNAISELRFARSPTRGSQTTPQRQTAQMSDIRTFRPGRIAALPMSQPCNKIAGSLVSRKPATHSRLLPIWMSRFSFPITRRQRRFHLHPRRRNRRRPPGTAPECGPRSLGSRFRLEGSERNHLFVCQVKRLQNAPRDTFAPRLPPRGCLCGSHRERLHCLAQHYAEIHVIPQDNRLHVT